MDSVDQIPRPSSPETFFIFLNANVDDPRAGVKLRKRMNGLNLTGGCPAGRDVHFYRPPQGAQPTPLYTDPKGRQ